VIRSRYCCVVFRCSWLLFTFDVYCLLPCSDLLLLFVIVVVIYWLIYVCCSFCSDLLLLHVVLFVVYVLTFVRFIVMCWYCL